MMLNGFTRFLYDTAITDGGGGAKDNNQGSSQTDLQGQGAANNTGGDGGGDGTGGSGTGTALTEGGMQQQGAVESQGDELKWLEGVDEVIRNDPSMRSIKTVESLAKSFVNSQKMIGADKVVIPGETATDQDWSVFFDKVGRPANASEYKLEVADGTKIDEGFFTGFKDVAHKAGLSNKQLSTLFDWYSGEAQKISEKSVVDVQAEAQGKVNALVEKWGEAADKNMTIAKTAVIEIDKTIPGFSQFLDEGHGNQPFIIELMHLVGKNFMEDTMKNSNVVSGFTTISPDDAQKKIDSIRGDKKHPFNDKLHENHGKAVQELQSLYELKHAGKKAKENPTNVFTIG